MTWSEQFAAYLKARDISQQDTAFALKVAPSFVSYWVRGTMPRLRTRKRIERWSRGAVPAEAA